MKGVICAVIGTLGMVHGASAFAGNCSNATLKGTLIASLAKSAAGAPRSTAFMESWDGRGALRYVEIDSNGSSTSGPYYGTGTYSISNDCVATVIYDGDTTQVYKYLVDEDGQGYHWVNNLNIGLVAAGRATLVSKDLFIDPSTPNKGPCTLQSLDGTMAFAVEKFVNGVPAASAGQEIYDGAGRVTYRQTDSDGYTTNSLTGTGTYTITPGCIASVYYDGSTTPFNYFVAPNGSAYWWVNNQNTGVVAAGMADRVSRPAPR